MVTNINLQIDGRGVCKVRPLRRQPPSAGVGETCAPTPVFGYAFDALYPRKVRSLGVVSVTRDLLLRISDVTGRINLYGHNVAKINFDPRLGFGVIRTRFCVRRPKSTSRFWITINSFLFGMKTFSINKILAVRGRLELRLYNFSVNNIHIPIYKATYKQ